MKPVDILNKWIDAVNNRDVEALTAFYDKEAVLIPTFSNKTLNIPAKIRDYFEKLSERDDLQIKLHEKTLSVQEISKGIYILSGIYNWCFKVEGELLNFEARFSFVMDIAKGSPVIHHHSSQFPRML